MDLAEELGKLKDLLDKGIITQEEFDAKKAQLLSAPVLTPQQQAAVEKDDGNIGWAILGFFFPLVGLILYLVWKDSKPLSAKKASKGALIGVIVVVALDLIAALGMGLFAASYY